MKRYINPDILRMQGQINQHLNETDHKILEQIWANNQSIVFRMKPDKRLELVYEDFTRPEAWGYRPGND